MINLGTVINNSLKTMEQHLSSQKFTWEGVDYICIPGSANKVGTLEEGGIALDADLVITVRKDLFEKNIYPNVKDIITYRNISYVIQSIVTNATNTFLKLVCKDVDKDL